MVNRGMMTVTFKLLWFMRFPPQHFVMQIQSSVTPTIEHYTVIGIVL